MNGFIRRVSPVLVPAAIASGVVAGINQYDASSKNRPLSVKDKEEIWLAGIAAGIGGVLALGLNWALNPNS